MKKTDVVKILESLLDPFDSELLMEKLCMQVLVDESEEAIQEGRVYTQDEVDRETEEWFKN